MVESIHLNLPKGPALLARAGVSLEDAHWFYRHCASGCPDPDRLAAIHARVRIFLERQPDPVQALPAPAHPVTAPSHRDRMPIPVAHTGGAARLAAS